MSTAPGRLRVDGWTVIDGFLSPDECDRLSRVLTTRHWPVIPDELVAWILDARWADLVLPILGPDVVFLREQMVTKAPRSQATVPWHQDSGYAPIVGEFLTGFVALDDITVDNGCLWMAPGSQTGGPVEHRASGYHREVVSPVAEPGEPVPLARGGVALFSSLLHHRSGPNNTDNTRPAWMVQFGPARLLDSATGDPVTRYPSVAVDGMWLEVPQPA